MEHVAESVDFGLFYAFAFAFREFLEAAAGF